MPHLSVPITAAGPLLDIVISVSQPRAEALRKASLQIPTPVQIRGLIDTGASCTCVDPAILAQFNLTPTGIGSFNTASSGTQSANASLYDMSLTLLHPQFPLSLGTISVAEFDLSAHGFDALIGRDVLANCLCVYDGELKLFTIGF